MGPIAQTVLDAVGRLDLDTLVFRHGAGGAAVRGHEGTGNHTACNQREAAGKRRQGAASQRQALLIDEKAVGTDQAKRFVLVVGDGNQTAYREVQLGSVQEGLRVVESGLKAGERIVVNGLQRVRPGDPVTPNMVPMGGAAPAAAKG